MAIVGSILFKRTLKQFLDCDDLESKKGIAIVDKLRDMSKDSLDRLIQVIPETTGMHRALLQEICVENIKDGSDELFLSKLDDDTTVIRKSAAEILSKSKQVNPAKLFKKLHEPDSSTTEILDVLGSQMETLKPDQIINNALKLNKLHAERLLKMAEGSVQPLNLELLTVEPSKIESPSIKIMLLRYLATLDQPAVAELVCKFLKDGNRTIVMEAMKALKNYTCEFDTSDFLSQVEKMSKHEREMILEIIARQANEDNVHKLGPWVCGKSDEVREAFAKIYVKHATTQNLERFLSLIEIQDWYGKDQAIKALQKFGSDKLFSAAKGLNQHANDFVRESALQFAAQSSDPGDFKKLWENALHDNWQIRESALEAIGRSKMRESLAVLKKVLDKYPESAPSILKAVSELGFGKGLEIAFKCLLMPEALIQREALESIGKLANKQHANVIRDKLLKAVPSLQATVRDTAGEVVMHLTKEYELPELNVDFESFFDTRLSKVVGSEAGTGSGEVAAADVETVNMEDFKKGDLWMDRYRIDREIGRGAMGRVMLAMDEMVEEPLILKFMHPELTAEAGSRERFLREVKYSRMVTHPNVIRIHDMLFQGNLSAISMEYFESRGIDEILKERKHFEPKEGLEILLQVANGMAAAHAKGVIHRDLKPSNILMDEHGLVKIVDFGIASASSNAEATLTKVGSVIGTPAYLSPERAQGKEADHRSDIYALGIIAYGMFTGQLPYSGEPMALLYQHLAGKAKPVDELRPELGPYVTDLVKKMMAVKVKKRLQTMDDVSRAITEVIGQIS